jgi:hypothetical protein
VSVSTDITTNTTWTNDKEYTLQGFIYVTNCATLTIQPGTVIKGDKGSKGALIITRCAKLIADGTADQPIVFTTNDPNPTYGSWGGLILLGRAQTNQVYNGTAGLGLIEGGLDPVKGLYGGGDQPGGAMNTDNSGSLRYVRVEYPGIAFQPNNEINGITFGAVGSGTTVDHVQVSYAGDDAFEWFGGTVNAKHLIAYRALDDDFDTDNGFAGNIQFALSLRDPQVADISGSNGWEADNNASGDGTTPKSKATFSNVTIVGPSGTVNSNYRRAAHLRRNTENAIFNSVAIGSYPVGLFLDGQATVDNATSGALVVKNSFFHGMATPLSGNAGGFDIAAYAASMAITTSTNSADAQLVDPFNLNLPNPRPAAGSPILAGASFTSNPRIQDAFFTPVSYAGAFGATGDWTCPWAKWPTAGCIPAASPTIVTQSTDITTNTTWTKDKEYILQGFVYVTNCATLTIEPGTVIRGDKGSKGALIITRCAKLIADGTADQPIVFTTNDPNPTYGSWGGLILLGRAQTNQVYNGITGLGLIEGGLDPVKGLYGGGDQPGGADNNDNSGTLRYVRVEYPGIAFQPNNEINGITFGSVGAGTTVDNVQVSYAGDDAFEWFGGTVNAKHLVAYRALDDDFDTDNGFAGNIQFAVAVRDPQVADISGSNGWEADNNASGDGTTPKSKATFSNVTIVGPTGTVNANYRRAAHLRRNTENAIFNSVAVGAYPVGLFIDGDATAANATSGALIVKNSFFHGMATPLSTNATNGFNITTYAASMAVTASNNAADAQLVDPFNLNLPNPRPASGSPILTGASFTSDPRIQNTFFTPVSYAGAFGPSGDWTCPWVKWPDNACIPAAAPGQVTVSTDITTNTTWTADKEYTLQGFIYVTNCATLTIEPGTVVKGDKGSKGALIITRCAKLDANGTKELPIVFTTNDPNPTYGSWGGLIILGRAQTNQVYNGVQGLGLIEGGIDPVKGLYGGGDQPGGAINNDNSGILNYVRVEYPGIAFQPNNEINGITFGAVGSGTLVDNVQVSYAGDDAFEWFGGTVNAKHLVAYRALDDDFDTDNGYAGKIQFALSVRDPQVADISGSNGWECDNNASGDGTTPKSRATFSNVTIVGPSGTVNANYRRGAHLRRNNENAIFNSVAVGAYPVGLFIDGDSCALNAQTGKLIVKNSFFNGMATPLSTNVASFNINSYATANSIVTSTNAADAQLVDPFNINLPNPRPAPNSPVLQAASFSSDARISDDFFTPVSYAGAFGPTGDWTCPWVKWNDAGCLPAPTPLQVTVSTDITTNTTWTADKEYTLQGFVYVTNCATLTIQPGTVIKGDKGSKGALIVTRCAKLIADGTKDLPIVFTTNDPVPSYGSWGGLIILGRAQTNQVYNGTPGLGLIEGGLDPAKALYGGGDQPGGADNNDNSGVLRYVRVEYPGIAFQPNNEINGITFGAVGAGTTVDYVQVSYAGDDAFEWFGGTVNAKHLIAYRALDDDFDTDNGFAGNVQHALSVRDPQVSDISGSNGFESDNNAAGDNTLPKTAPTFSNVTIVGPSGTVGANYRRAAHLRRSTELGLFNSLLIGSYPVGLLIDGNNATANATDGKLEVKNTILAGETDLLNTNVASFDIDTWYATAGWGNKQFPTNAEAALQNPFNLDVPNAQPTFASPALAMGAFTAPRINTPFFDKVTYIGAFAGTGAASDWTCGWAKYKDLNVTCLVETKDAAKFISSVKLFPTVANDQTTLELSLTESADLTVEIYGLNGQYFGQQVSEKAAEGVQTYTLNTSNLAQGFYFVRIQAGNAVTTEKLIVVR